MKFKTEVALSILTGRLLCKFDEMHECIEFLAGEPVFTHQLAHRAFAEELAAAVRFQLPALNAPEITVTALDNLLLTLETDTGNQHTDALLSGWISTEIWPRLGKTVELVSMPNMRTAAASFTEPLEGKEVLFIEVPKDGPQ